MYIHIYIYGSCIYVGSDFELVATNTARKYINGIHINKGQVWYIRTYIATYSVSPIQLNSRLIMV